MRQPPRSLVLTAVALAGLLLAAGAPARAEGDAFDLVVDVTFEPERGGVAVELRVTQDDDLLRRLTLRPKSHWADHYTDVEGDGEVTRDGKDITWLPPPAGGSLRYRIRFDHRRHGDADGGYDARITDDWAICLSDIFVPSPSRSFQRGAESRTTLQFHAPSGWLYDTPFRPTGSGQFEIADPDERLDRPRGWIVAGKGLARRRATIAGCQLLIAAPPSDAPAAGEIHDFLRQNLPPLLDVFERLPERILVASAGDPMWSGGVSGQGSVFVNAGQRLFNPDDGTSTMLHELVHVLTAPPGADADGDWFIEGLAEYYALEARRRSGDLTPQQHQACLAYLEERGKDVETIRVTRSRFRVTQRAVVALYRLDALLRQSTEDRVSLDDVARVMDTEMEDRTTASFQALCERVSQLDLDTFFRDEIP